ncbi:head completion protein [Shigella phage JK32]|nr:head completion protein [Shigella phage JK32]
MGGSNTYKGKYKPENPEKYKGNNLHKITYRSSWELHIMKFLDRSPSVAKWNSECVIIPYWSSADKRSRKYHMDFWVKFVDGKEFLWEVKPAKETIPPQKPKRITTKTKQRYMQECYTYTVNTEKWKAAVDLCQKHNMEFKIITEHALKKVFGFKGLNK